MSPEYSSDKQTNSGKLGGLEKNPNKIDLQQEELAFLRDENQKKEAKNKADDKYYRGKATVSFLQDKKKEMKNTEARKKFDRLYTEIEGNLVNTEEQNPSAGQRGGSVAKQWTQMMMPFNGGKNYRNIYTLSEPSTSTTSLPESYEPYTFSKVLVATALFGTKIPDAHFEAQDNVWAHTMYKLWKETWQNNNGNGEACLEAFTQNTFLYGWAAMRTYPKRIQQMSKGVPRIKFDDIYRQSLLPNRTWLGVNHSNSDRWSQTEYLFEEDMSIDTFSHLFPDADKKKLEYATASTQDGSNSGSALTHVTITHYENELTNRFIKSCGDYVIYDGELLNEDGHVDITVANCFVRNQCDPYGVGLYELARSNERVANHLRLLNAEQMEAEIRPLLFGATFGNGEMTYKRGANIINPKPQGTTLDVVRTTGNVAMGMNYVKSEKNSLDDVIGINATVSGTGSESTLGGTVIAREAAQQRLILPRNSIIRALEHDADVTVSFIEQTYPAYYIYEAKTQEDVVRFKKLNEHYSTQEATVDGKLIVLASKKLSIDFDFDIDDIDEDNVDNQGIDVEETERPIVVSRKQLFDVLLDLKERVGLSRVLDVQIDASSMLQPSEELSKQSVMSLYPIISEQTVMIMQAAQEQPELAEVMIKQLMQLLDVNRLDAAKWLPKDMVNRIIRGELLNEDMQALAVGNRQMELAEQAQEMGMQSPEQGQAPAGNIATNPMQTAINTSINKTAAAPEQSPIME